MTPKMQVLAFCFRFNELFSGFQLRDINPQDLIEVRDTRTTNSAGETIECWCFVFKRPYEADKNLAFFAKEDFDTGWDFTTLDDVKTSLAAAYPTILVLDKYTDVRRIDSRPMPEPYKDILFNRALVKDRVYDPNNNWTSVFVFDGGPDAKIYVVDGDQTESATVYYDIYGDY